jgi:hypothetical protein
MLGIDFDKRSEKEFRIYFRGKQQVGDLTGALLEMAECAKKSARKMERWWKKLNEYEAKFWQNVADMKQLDQLFIAA